MYPQDPKCQAHVSWQAECDTMCSREREWQHCLCEYARGWTRSLLKWNGAGQVRRSAWGWVVQQSVTPRKVIGERRRQVGLNRESVSWLCGGLLKYSRTNIAFNASTLAGIQTRDAPIWTFWPIPIFAVMADNRYLQISICFQKKVSEIKCFTVWKSCKLNFWMSSFIFKTCLTSK